MAKYQKYAEYKDSGIKWLGEIPEHWIITLLKRYSFVKGGYAFSSDIFTSVGKPIIRIGDIQADGSISLENCKYIPVAVAENSQDYLITKGQILMAMTGATIGKAGIFDSDEVAYLNQRVGKFIVDSKSLNYDYLWYLLKTHGYQEYIRLTAFGGAQPNISDTAMVDFCISIPSIDEQIKIAKFLDHETSKIDNLIAKQEKLIELLKEKRQAVISHAVTKGLNPNVPMKDSGVEWLGEVPEHWIVSKFGYISQVVRGGSPRPAGDPALFNGDYSPWVTVAEITKDDELYLTSTETFLTKKGSEQCRVFQSGTLLLSNSGATLGVPKILSINANANDGVVGFEDLKIDTEYAYFYLSVLTNDLRERVKQGSGQPNLNTDIVKAISITIPPENEIREIVADIKKKIDHFSKLMTSAENAIQLMQERRTALISAAVTGKIDVRDWQHPNQKNNTHTELSA